MMWDTKKIGLWGEATALSYLEQNGFKRLQTRYCSRYGEIDLIVEGNGTILFVEVKVRRSLRYGNASESITITKQRKIIKTAYVFLQEYPVYESYDLRFDAICIQIKQQVAKPILQDFSLLNYDLEWIQDAFNLDEV
ncbi:YraN family protein [Acinetobacter sp. ESL0695]|jgi:putative endonuclease|uniref:YraN family protein n=1 Tax=Acinetobacter sp. ESL0695 TaxID=2983215 RepID=UPI0023F0BB65|nr:YraN family protein [Acinetobacter sp. ESL0695]WEV48315.1 YraN family protein [Acinetobacter sp. ESL0695]